MTDKQKIVNGVDVSECIYYQYNMCTATKDNYGDCSFYCKDYDMNDCYYKQLQREKQNSQEARDTAIKEFNRAEELKTLLKDKEQKLVKIRQILGVYYDDDWKATREIERVLNEK